MYTKDNSGQFDLRVRNVDNWVIEEIKARSKRNGRSLSAEIRAILREEAERSRQELVAGLKRHVEKLRRKYGTFSDSAILIREDRDARG